MFGKLICKIWFVAYLSKIGRRMVRDHIGIYILACYRNCLKKLKQHTINMKYYRLPIVSYEKFPTFGA